PAGVAGIAADGDLRARLERLLADPPPASPMATTAAASAVTAVASALVLSVCLAVHGGSTPLDVLACLSVLAALALPPLRRLLAAAAARPSTTYL
ncbi:MAG TPA: hypothetical protein VE995_07245, partial [Gaiellaceae bacterium]|nr:hypothetical protein [Gaiellaceae bacterium]